jgi:hypothetical protein
MSSTRSCRTLTVPSLAILEAIQLAKFSLTAAIALAQGTSAIPDKEVIAPNQKSWMEMAMQMGIKKAPKCKRLPEESGLTKRSIGIAKGKKVRIYNDPYAGGKQSGKCTKCYVLQDLPSYMPISGTTVHM